MVEADVLLRGERGDPILAHPPDTDSDITLQEWLAEMVSTNKGIKLDFKRYLNKKIMFFAFLPVTILQVIVNQTAPCAAPVLSPGYAWPMVQEMSRLCQPLSQPVTFAVRAALVPSSVPQLQWLMQQSHRYSLTVWTGKEDMYSVEDLLFIRENFDKSRVYYDIFEPQNSEFKKAIGIEW
ncbi:PREDICTED: protein FAM151B [Corvus brachyrhynchos]|uniref:protein FAM151B n=1 Tax=Corvus brachyrhynchos TaxID=85066 RepID=UPI00081674BA|nr:PREDICTED: protein FAM151B [Corvus brachyrhynchos]